MNWLSRKASQKSAAGSVAFGIFGRSKSAIARKASESELSTEACMVALGYTLLATFCAWQLSLQLFVSSGFAGVFTIAFLIAVALCFIRLGPLATLLVVLVSLFLSEIPRWDPLGFFEKLWLVTLALLLMISSFRMQFLLSLYQVSWFVALGKAWKQLTAGTSQAGNSTAAKPAMGIAFDILVLLAGTVVAILVAAIVMRIVPLPDDSIANVRLRPTALRLIQLSFVCLITYFVMRSFVGQISWRRNSPRQAHAYLLSTLLSWFIVDGRAIAKRTTRFRKKLLKERQERS